MNYRLYNLAAGYILNADLPSNYSDEWLEENVCEKSELTARQIEDKIQELYDLLQVAYDMGLDFQQFRN